ncbi:MAG: tRNA (guanosine(37)-N1)-methyltransferase TrmD [Bacilli bacterium]|nr:tRNA (guanosine(37)-N1)-methyltransferase TrmD [Bacilli bacterium]
MKIDILTLFPEMFEGFKKESIIKRAIDNKKVSIKTHNFRDYAKNKHKKVDDTPYGGGAGMVLMCQPIFDAVEDLKKEDSKVILLTPQGKTYNEEKAYELSKEKHLIFICGHYEGFDERIRTIADEEISIGDYVLTGGELPSMVLTDSIVRLLPGVIEEESHLNDSFNDNLLDYPTYTKPRNYKGMKVPEVLLSGDHKKIDEWRKNESLKITSIKRPDLLNNKISLERHGLKRKNDIYVDDIKDIKVIEIKEKNGTYKLFKENKINAVTIFDPKIVSGYKLKGKSKNATTKILIVKEEFIGKVAYKNVIKKIDVLAKRFNMALYDEDDDSSSRVLGEAEMLKSMIISMYSKYFNGSELDTIIKNINNLVNEFVRAKTKKNMFIGERNIEQRIR